MDRGFMEHYFDVTFNDAIGEIAGNDERYAELQSVTDEAVHTLAGIVGKSNTALWEQCEHTINSLYTLQLHLVKLAYLRGAEAKGHQVKMVRIMEQNIGFCRVLLLLEPLFLYNKYQKGGVF